jgi:hypothetical protein
MHRRTWLGALVVLLAACSALGPPSIRLSRGEIAERAFAERKVFDLRRFLRGVDGVTITGPDVGFQLQAQRIEFAWTASVAGPMGVPLSLRVSISGQPVLNEQKNGLDLADTRVEEVRLPSIPFVNFDRRSLQAPGTSLGTLPLLQFAPEELTRDGIVYQPTGVELGTFGLRVDLAPK